MQVTANHVIKFVDDILMKSGSKDEHLEHIKQLLGTLGKATLSIKLKKYKFFQDQVKFLCFIISTEAPGIIKQLKSFLGMVNFFTRFSEKHADAIITLLYLLKK